MTVFWIGAALAIAMQWVAFVPAYLRRTERFYDLVGSLTFLTVITHALWYRPPGDLRALVLAAMVIAWTLRLGTFLVRRIHQRGRDDRFEAIKQSAPRFLLAWTLQGLWVAVTSAPAVLAIAGEARIDAFLVVGALIWVIGFTLEIAADAQKARFAADPANRGRFISTGLWAVSRHPNYLGEIILWCGVSVAAFPALEGWERLSLVSPLFVGWLLVRVSGIPLLERKADAKWGHEPEYVAYRDRTPVLVPRIPSARRDRA